MDCSAGTGMVISTTTLMATDNNEDSDTDEGVMSENEVRPDVPTVLRQDAAEPMTTVSQAEATGCDAVLSISLAAREGPLGDDHRVVEGLERFLDVILAALNASRQDGRR